MERDHQDHHFWSERITKVERAICAYEDAILALSGGAQSYSLNTGQTTQSVTKASLGEMRTTLEDLLTKRAYYKTQRDGLSFIARPGF